MALTAESPMNRRSFLTGMAGILASATAPWVVTKAGVLMPVKQIVTGLTTDAIDTSGADLIFPVSFGEDGIARVLWSKAMLREL